MLVKNFYYGSIKRVVRILECDIMLRIILWLIGNKIREISDILGFLNVDELYKYFY